MKIFDILLISLTMAMPSFVFAKWQNVNSKYTLYFLAANDNYIFARDNDWNLFRSSDDGLKWDSLILDSTKYGGINSVIVDDTILIAGSEYYDIYISNDNGLSWKSLDNGMPPNAQIIILFNYHNCYFAATDSGLFRSTNGGSNWISDTNDIPYSSSIVSIAGTDSALFCSTNYNELYESKDSGLHWISLHNIPQSSQGYTLLGCGNYLFANNYDNNGQIFRTSNNGLKWNIVDSGLPADFVLSNSLIYDSVIFINNDDDLWISTNYGNNWVEIDFGIVPSYSEPLINSMIIQSDYIYVSTSFNGIWRRPLAEIITNITQNFALHLPTAPFLFQNYPNPFISFTQIPYSVAQAGDVSISIINELGSVIAEPLHTRQAAGDYTISFDGSALPPGMYFVRYTCGSAVQVKPMMLVR